MVGLPNTNCPHLFVEEWSQGLKLATFSSSLISMKGIKMHVIKMLSTLLSRGLIFLENTYLIEVAREGICQRMQTFFPVLLFK